MLPRTTAAVVLAVTAAVTSGAASRGPTAARNDDPVVHLTANLEDRKLVIQEGDSVVVSYPVAVGKDSKPTPTGTYMIRKIVWNPAWIPPDEKWAQGKKPQAPGAKANPMKLVKIFFKEPDYYIHGTGDVESLGEAASHGCLRMDPDDAYRVARYVMEHGGQPRDESWFWRVLHSRSETKTVMLDHPIPIVVE
jgi:lipoprotein-anchoring transpeptidase ErfK/SrfK